MMSDMRSSVCIIECGKTFKEQERGCTSRDAPYVYLHRVHPEGNEGGEGFEIPNRYGDVIVI